MFDLCAPCIRVAEQVREQVRDLIAASEGDAPSLRVLMLLNSDRIRPPKGHTCKPLHLPLV